MISYQVYKVMHLLGNFMIIAALGGLIVHIINGGSKEHSFRKGVAMTHGIGLLLSLVGGFGALARLGIVQAGLPGWVYVKVAIWLLFGGMTAILVRKPEFAKSLWFVTLVLAGLGAYLGGAKPF